MSTALTKRARTDGRSAVDGGREPEPGGTRGPGEAAGLRPAWLSARRGHPAGGGRRLVASIYFENASADLDPLDLSVIRGCVRDGLGAGITELELAGFASVSGEADANVELSRQRLESVRAAVVDDLAARGRLGALDGWQQPFRAHGPVGTMANQAASRRVDVFMRAPSPRRGREGEARVQRKGEDEELSVTATDRKDYATLLVERDEMADELHRMRSAERNKGQVAAWHGSEKYRLSEESRRKRAMVGAVEKLTRGAPYPGERGGDGWRRGLTRRWAEQDAQTALAEVDELEARLKALDDRLARHPGAP